MKFGYNIRSCVHFWKRCSPRIWGSVIVLEMTEKEMVGSSFNNRFVLEHACASEPDHFICLPFCSVPKYSTQMPNSGALCNKLSLCISPSSFQQRIRSASPVHWNECLQYSIVLRFVSPDNSGLISAQMNIRFCVCQHLYYQQSTLKTMPCMCTSSHSACSVHSYVTVCHTGVRLMPGDKLKDKP